MQGVVDGVPSASMSQSEWLPSPDLIGGRDRLERRGSGVGDPMSVLEVFDDVLIGHFPHRHYEPLLFDRPLHSKLPQT